MRHTFLPGIALLLIVLTVAVMYLTIAPKNNLADVIPSAPETVEQVRRLMQVTEECTLPCFWGFMPGDSTVEDVIDFIQPEPDLSHLEGQYILEYFFFENHENTPTVSLNFWIDDDQLSMMTATIRELTRILPENSISFQNLLRILDSEPEIYISANSTTFIFSIVVIDDNAGIMVQYTLPFQVQGDVALSPTSEVPIWLCPRIDQYSHISVTLQNADFEPPISDNTTLGRSLKSGRQLKEKGHYLTLEEIVNDDIGVVIDQIIQDPEYCIETLTYRRILEYGW